MARQFVIKMGFLNTPYSNKALNAPMRTARAGEAKRQNRGFKKTMTATDVGAILEGKYNVVESFVATNKDEILDLVTDKLEEAVIGSLTDKVKTGDKLVIGMKGRTRQIDKLFRNFLDMDEMSSVIENKSANKNGRKSFVNTGIYRASFRSWIEK
jgi:ethanolamine utilization protein EutQ (cupin superfamily)